MRFQLLLSPSDRGVNYNYQSLLTGAIHKWLGINDIHDQLSLYSFSWLNNASVIDNQLHFKKGSNWFISFWDNDFGVELFKGIKKDPVAIAGMKVEEIKLLDDPDLSNIHRFIAASPILIRDFEGENYKHYTYKDDISDNLLTATLARKLKSVGHEGNGFNVRFDRSYAGAKTKLVDIHGIKNRASVCPVIIEGDEIVKKFAWNVGIGHSTGTGFGAIR